MNVSQCTTEPDTVTWTLPPACNACFQSCSPFSSTLQCSTVSLACDLVCHNLDSPIFFAASTTTGFGVYSYIISDGVLYFFTDFGCPGEPTIEFGHDVTSFVGSDQYTYLPDCSNVPAGSTETITTATTTSPSPSPAVQAGVIIGAVGVSVVLMAGFIILKCMINSQASAVVVSKML